MSNIASAASPAPRHPRWHKIFLAMLPQILTRARFAFRNLNPEAKAEAVQEVVANALQAFVRLVQLKKVALAYPSALANFGIKQARDGRKVGGHLNCLDISSRYCQRLKNIVLERLDQFDRAEEQWQEVLVEDHRAGPFDIVRTKLDFEAWLHHLPRRNRRIAQFLAAGNPTDVTARKFKVSAGRISQLRKELAGNWKRFIGDDEPGAAALAA